MPMVVSASISWVTFMVPSWAANAAPVRPAMTMPVIIAPDGDPDQVGDVDRGAELLQLHGADEGHDHTDQEADQRHDRQRVGARLLDVEPEVAPAKTGPIAQQGDKGDRHLAEEGDELARRLREGEGAEPDPRNEAGSLRVAARALAFGHRLGEGEQALDAL